MNMFATSSLKFRMMEIISLLLTHKKTAKRLMVTRKLGHLTLKKANFHGLSEFVKQGKIGPIVAHGAAFLSIALNFTASFKNR